MPTRHISHDSGDSLWPKDDVFFPKHIDTYLQSGLSQDSCCADSQPFAPSYGPHPTLSLQMLEEDKSVSAKEDSPIPIPKTNTIQILNQTKEEYNRGHYATVAQILYLQPKEGDIFLQLVKHANDLLGRNIIDTSIIPHIILFAMHVQDVESILRQKHKGGKLLVDSLKKLQAAEQIPQYGDLIKEVLTLQDIKYGGDKKSLLHTIAAHPDLNHILHALMNAGWKDIDCLDKYDKPPLTYAMTQAAAKEKPDMSNVYVLLHNKANLFAGKTPNQPMGLVTENPALWRENQTIWDEILLCIKDSTHQCDAIDCIISANENGVSQDELSILVETLGLKDEDLVYS